MAVYSEELPQNVVVATRETISSLAIVIVTVNVKSIRISNVIDLNIQKYVGCRNYAVVKPTYIPISIYYVLCSRTFAVGGVLYLISLRYLRLGFGNIIFDDL